MHSVSHNKYITVETIHDTREYSSQNNTGRLTALRSQFVFILSGSAASLRIYVGKMFEKRLESSRRYQAWGRRAGDRALASWTATIDAMRNETPMKTLARAAMYRGQRRIIDRRDGGMLSKAVAPARCLAEVSSKGSTL